MLKNIFGEVDLHLRKGQKIGSMPMGAELRDMRKYDYLAERPRGSEYPSEGVAMDDMPDLQSSMVTNHFHEGLVLWPGKELMMRVKLEEEAEERSHMEAATEAGEAQAENS